MDRLSHPFFPLLIIVPVLMSAMSFVKFIRYKKNEFRHLSEFYLSMGLVAVSAWVLLPLGSAFVVLSMLPWMWTLRTMGLVTEDIGRLPLFTRFHYLILGLGGVISLIFLSFDFSLPMVTTPFALSVGLIGLTFFLQAFIRKGKSFSYLYHINIFLILAFFISRLAYPVLISNPARIQLVAVVECYLLFAFCAALYPLYAEIVFERHNLFLEEVLHTRNRQLFSHSGFSEFKILSAGLSHEINNALTVINAKIALLLRGKSKDIESDLRIIQNASGRIVRSIRGLREFIYPREGTEVMELEEIVKEVLALYGQRLNNHGVMVEVNSLSEKLIKGKRIEIEQVFLTLINNSVDAIDKLEDKWIKINSHVNSAGKVEITYQDSGPSNAETIIPLLEDPFYATHEFMDNDIRLILAKEIVVKHGGALRCVKNQDHSTFLITFPLTEGLRSTRMEVENKIEAINELH